jgi:hypothetical protein
MLRVRRVRIRAIQSSNWSRVILCTDTKTPPERSERGCFFCRGSRQVRVSETNHAFIMDLILSTPEAVEVVIAVCVAPLFGLATYLALT